MWEHPLKTLIKKANRSIEQADWEALMEFYAEDAILVVKPGVVARGKEQIEQVFRRVYEYFHGEMIPGEKEMVVLETGDTALVLAHTFLEVPLMAISGHPMKRNATYVFRKDEEGKWRCLVDNSYGTSLIPD